MKVTCVYLQALAAVAIGVRLLADVVSLDMPM